MPDPFAIKFADRNARQSQSARLQEYPLNSATGFYWRITQLLHLPMLVADNTPGAGADDENTWGLADEPAILRRV